MLAETAVLTIERYLDDEIEPFEPGSAVGAKACDAIRLYSYRHWAACELIFEIMDSPREDPVNVIDRFRFLMASRAGRLEERNLYSEAAAVADEILMLLV